jgi:hypothetical protein
MSNIIKPRFLIAISLSVFTFRLSTTAYSRAENKIQWENLAGSPELNEFQLESDVTNENFRSEV